MISDNNKYRLYNADECIIFLKTDEAFGGLSNMASGYSMLVNENLILSSEALYQACRYPLFPKIQAEIIKQTSPMTAKMVSKKYLPFTRQDWEAVKFKVMRWALEVKLSQNWNSFSRLLNETGNKNIVELSKKDKVWGAVLTEKNTLYGINALGRLLMELRENYVLKNNKINCVEPPDITGFLLFEHPIGVVCNDDYYMKEHGSKETNELIFS